MENKMSENKSLSTDIISVMEMDERYWYDVVTSDIENLFTVGDPIRKHGRYFFCASANSWIEISPFDEDFSTLKVKINLNRGKINDDEQQA